jgi:hypothetical protein
MAHKRESVTDAKVGGIIKTHDESQRTFASCRLETNQAIYTDRTEKMNEGGWLVAQAEAVTRSLYASVMSRVSRTNLLEEMKGVLRDAFPDDIHERASGKLVVAVTQVSGRAYTHLDFGTPYGSQ